jgi:hypothetical protein
MKNERMGFVVSVIWIPLSSRLMQSVKFPQKCRKLSKVWDNLNHTYVKYRKELEGIQDISMLRVIILGSYAASRSCGVSQMKISYGKA